MEQSLDRLIDLAREVGGEAFPMLVYRIWVKAVIGICIFYGLTLISGIFSAVCFGGYVKYKETEPWLPMGFISMGASLLFAFIATLGFLPVVLAPEGEALIMIMEQR